MCNSHKDLKSFRWISLFSYSEYVYICVCEKIAFEKMFQSISAETIVVMSFMTLTLYEIISL